MIFFIIKTKAMFTLQDKPELPLAERDWNELNEYQRKRVWQEKHWLNHAAKMLGAETRLHYSKGQSGTVNITARWLTVADDFTYLYSNKDGEKRIDHVALKTLVGKSADAFKGIVFSNAKVLATYDGLEPGDSLKIEYPEGNQKKDIDFQTILEFELNRNQEWVKIWVLKEEYDTVAGYRNRFKTIRSHSNDYSGMPS